MAERTDIKNFSLMELKAEMERIGEPSYRAEQIFSWLYQKGSLDFYDFTNLSKSFRDKLGQLYFIGGLTLSGHFQSQDKTKKFLFRLQDGNFVETVLIPSGQRNTVCLSSQVGCKFACAFCASGLKGFIRDLTPSEMVNQVLYLRQGYEEHLTNLVFMGMGEPLDNYKNVVKAIFILNSPQGLGIAARRMTVSTCGLVPGIECFKDLGLQVNLSVSLHVANDRLRTRLMPINKKYPLENLIRACEKYIESGGRKLSLEYILIQSVNDSFQDADGLAQIAGRLKARVNLILYSPVSGLTFKAPSGEKVSQFMKRLEERKTRVTLRQSKGKDILAACGQLACRSQE